MRIRLICCVALLLAPAYSVAQGQAPPSKDSRLASIQVKGTERYTPEDVVRLSGLAIGTPITADDFTAATT